MIATSALELAGTHRPEDVAEGVACGRFQSWGDGDTVMVTEVLDTPLRRTIHFFLAEGEMAVLRAMTPAILNWARDRGCTHASLVGRKGWTRVAWMRESGWTEEGVMMGRTL